MEIEKEPYKGIFMAIIQQPRLATAYVGILIFGIMLLVYDKLSPDMQNYTVPSIAIFSLGAALIAMYYRLITFHYELYFDREKIPRDINKLPNNECLIHIGWRITFGVLNCAWFILFVAYNVWRLKFFN